MMIRASKKTRQIRRKCSRILLPASHMVGSHSHTPCLLCMTIDSRGLGYDGIELACWEDHFDVQKALNDGYCGVHRYVDSIHERPKITLPEGERIEFVLVTTPNHTHFESFRRSSPRSTVQVPVGTRGNRCFAVLQPLHVAERHCAAFKEIDYDGYLSAEAFPLPDPASTAARRSPTTAAA